MVYFRTNSFAFRTGLSFLLLIFTIAFIGGCAKREHAAKLSIVQEPFIASPVPAESLEPGLSVLYFYQLFRSVNQLPRTEAVMRGGKPGPPIMQLNHRFGRGVEVFDSGASQGVGMIMRGYLHLEKPGKYTFQAKSNDGFALYLDGRLIITDPGVHGDRLSDQGEVTVTEGGWFPVLIRYYQRKGTAALSLYWKSANGTDFVVIPPEAYAH